MSVSPRVAAVIPEGFDVFAEFEGANREVTSAELHAKLAEARRRSPVYDGNLMADLFPGYREDYGTRTLTTLGWKACFDALSDPETFSSEVYRETLGRTQGINILMLDGEEHRRHRAILRAVFSRRGIAKWRKEVIDPIVRDYVDRVCAQGTSADLVREIFWQFPVDVLQRILGLPPELHDDFAQLGLAVNVIGRYPEIALGASQALDDLLTPMIRERRKHPREDAISMMLDLDDGEVLSTIRVLLPAGAETTTRTSGNLMVGLLSHREQLERLQRDRSLIPGAIEEGLRWESPVPAVHRLATHDVEFYGVQVPKGAHVNICVASANRDEARFPDPERFDITRDTSGHMAFGFAAHLCLGMHLAHAELASLLEALLDRMPRLRLDPERDGPQICGTGFRSPPVLHARWD